MCTRLRKCEMCPPICQQIVLLLLFFMSLALFRHALCDVFYT